MATPIDPILLAGLSSHDQQLVAVCDVWRDGVVVLQGLRITGGSVQISSSQSPRRSISLTAVDDGGDLVPGVPTDALAPYGNEIAVYRGLRIGGVVYTVPVGVYRIDGASTTYSGGAVTISITGADRSARVSDDKFTDNATVAAGTMAGDAIKTLVSPALPMSQNYAFPVTTPVITQQLYAPNDDRWEKATNLAADAGCILAFDASGTLVLQPVIDPLTATPTMVFAPGQAQRVGLVSVTAALTSAGAKNYVSITAQGTGIAVPLRAVSEDDDPTSPTYVLGPFGKRPDVSTTTTLTTLVDLQAAADARLLLLKGATQQVSFTCIVAPHLDAFDVAQLTVPETKTAGRYVIDTITMPLLLGTMAVTTRGVVLA